MTDRLLLTIAETAEALALSPRMVGYMIARGEIPVLHVGRAARVPADWLRHWVNERAAEAGTPAAQLEPSHQRSTRRKTG